MALHRARSRDPGWSQRREEAVQRNQGHGAGGAERAGGGPPWSTSFTAHSPLRTCSLPQAASKEPPTPTPGQQVLSGACPPPQALRNPSPSGRNGRYVPPQGQAANQHHPESFSKTKCSPGLGTGVCKKLSGDCCAAGDSVFFI